MSNTVDLEKENMKRFIKSLLNPEDFGHSVTAEVRDEARYVLGMKKVETVSKTPATPVLSIN